MHNLAIALQQQGYIITGSDDNIYDPSRTRLLQHGLLPAETGWFPEKVHVGLSAVIVGMHALINNPELIKAQELSLPIFSYPEFLYQQSQQKQRVVIAGSHGKTTITAMILHVLQYHNRLFDYLVGEQINGFETMAKLTSDAPVIIIEGDEYASSPIDSRPKFLHYHPHIALISGIAWDHVNLYPTWEAYVDQFELLAEAMPKGGILVFDESDDMLDVIGQKERADITKVPYQAHKSEIIDNQTFLIDKQGNKIQVQLFGDYNLKNISGAMTVCDRIGITENQFYEAISSFKPVALRLEKIAERTDNNSKKRTVIRDFAHSPAKVEATVQAVKNQYGSEKLCAILELNSFSSLSKSFLSEYKDTLSAANIGVVYININAKPYLDKTDPITTIDVVQSFGRLDLNVFTESDKMQNFLIDNKQDADIFLFMSSGKFNDVDINALSLELL